MSLRPGGCLYPPFLGAARMLAVVVWRMRVYGRENLPAHGGFLIAANHQSVLDPFLVALAADARGVDFMARSTLFIGGFGRVIRAWGAFPVERDQADWKALKEAERRVLLGRPLAVFPEGTRTRDGSIGPFKAGLGIIAHRAGAPVVPAAIRGAYEAWPKGSRMPRFAPLAMAFGTPLPAPVSRKEVREYAETLRERVKELYESLRP